MKTPIETYFEKIETDFRKGNATEHTYRSTIEILIESLGMGIDASNDPKHIDCGAPDFIVEKGKVPLGYVETKDVGADLEKIEKTDQIKRYLKALNNLILTDYLEFRWYVNGQRKLKVRLAEVGKNNRLTIIPQGGVAVEQLFRDFFATEAPTVRTPKELAERLAGVTHFIRDQIIAALESGDPDIKKALEQQYKTFVDLLLPAITHAEFADLYAQAITYGLFAAKLSAPEGAAFAFEDAYKYLRGNPFLRRLFMDVNEQIDEIDIIRPYLKDLVSLLNRADFASILIDFGRRIRTEDPVVHFYETFLATYDPKMRKSRGVYYTPEPVVQFMVRAVDDLLKTHFGKSWGLADESVKVLDPATGTGTFLYYVIQKIHEEVVEKRKQAGQWQAASKQLLGRIFGFELLIAPYVISHLKLGLLLQTLGAPLEGKDERLHVYLTNSLEEGIERAEMLAGLGLNIAKESSDAASVKKANDIMVVLGNPPYSNFGRINRGKWILKLLDDYKKDLFEKKLNLDDDYIKFIRFGQWRINKTGQGILAYITNNSFIDGLTHRRMRYSLMETFTDIYILDLHGNSNKQEKTPNGLIDENVFDIQQGVSISIFIKEAKKSGLANVHHYELWGSREDKYRQLRNSDITCIDWQKIANKSKYNFFIPKLASDLFYDSFWSLDQIFSISGGGLNTDRDGLCIDFESEPLIDRIKTLFSGKYNNEFKEKYKIFPSSSYNIEKKAKNSVFKPESIRDCIYRPFDFRKIYYQIGFTSRPVFEVQGNMLFQNFALISSRQTKEEFAVLTTNYLSTHKIVTVYDRSYTFPLYLYPHYVEMVGTLFNQTQSSRQANLNPKFIQEFSAKLEMHFIPDGEGDKVHTFGPEDVFYYTYAMFHNPTYRSRYAEFLKMDFPRLPLTSDKKLFKALVEKGKLLVNLHLLKSPKVDNFITSYQVTGDNKVVKVQYASGKVWINPTQYFGGVQEDVWNFKIGGYQVCEKWLKDRKGRMLSGEDISHYQRVVVALKETIRLMAEIDKAIPGWPIK